MFDMRSSTFILYFYISLTLETLEIDINSSSTVSDLWTCIRNFDHNKEVEKRSQKTTYYRKVFDKQSSTYYLISSQVSNRDALENDFD